MLLLEWPICKDIHALFWWIKLSLLNYKVDTCMHWLRFFSTISRDVFIFHGHLFLRKAERTSSCTNEGAKMIRTENRYVAVDIYIAWKKIHVRQRQYATRAKTRMRIAWQEQKSVIRLTFKRREIKCKLKYKCLEQWLKKKEAFDYVTFS